MRGGGGDKRTAASLTAPNNLHHLTRPNSSTRLEPARNINPTKSHSTQNDTKTNPTGQTK
jgi:hypothetical protein